MHDMSLWMAGNVLQNCGVGGAGGAVRAACANGNSSVVSHCAVCASVSLAVLQSHLEHCAGIQMRQSTP